MRAARGLIAVVFGLLLPVGCTPGEGGGPTPGTGGSTTGRRQWWIDAGTAGTTGTAGSVGSGGSAAGTGGSVGGGGSVGSTAGAGGTASGTAGWSAARLPAQAARRPAPAVRRDRRGEAAAQGARRDAAGTGGAAGRGGGGGGGATGAAGTSGAAGAGAGDAYVSGVTVTVHAQTRTILVVTWTQAISAEQTFLEFSFAGSGLMTSRAQAGATGAHRDVVLGVPASTAVTVRIVSRQGGVDYKTRDYMGTTGALPTGIPLPTLLSYNAALASSDRYMFGSVEDSTGGCTDGNCYYDGVFWVYIMDRQARIVWYYADAANNAATSFPAHRPRRRVHLAREEPRRGRAAS